MHVKCRQLCGQEAPVVLPNLAANGKAVKQVYVSRSVTLRNMGFKNYCEYLGSDLWRRVRAEAFQLHGRKCFGCGRYAGYIHHKSYTRQVLKGHNLKQLVPVCRSCHKRMEFYGDIKLTTNEANSRMRGIAKAVSKSRPMRQKQVYRVR